VFPGLANHESRAVVDFHCLIRQPSKTIIELLRGRISDCDQSYLEVGVKSLIDGVMSLCGLPTTVMAADKQNELKEIEVRLSHMAFLRPSDLTGLGVRPHGEAKVVQHDAERVPETAEDASLLGTLTPVGKSQVLRGERICEKSSIAYRKDPLSRPYLSTDVKAVVKALIGVSKSLNAHFDLPACKDSIYLTWPQMIEREVHRHETVHGGSTSHVIIRFFYYCYLYSLKALSCLPQGFRFNLRCWGNMKHATQAVGLLSTVLYLLSFMTGGVFVGILLALLVVSRAYGWV
jgi:hypothetical protein